MFSQLKVRQFYSSLGKVKKQIWTKASIFLSVWLCDVRFSSLPSSLPTPQPQHFFFSNSFFLSFKWKFNDVYFSFRKVAKKEEEKENKWGKKFLYSFTYVDIRDAGLQIFLLRLYSLHFLAASLVAPFFFTLASLQMRMEFHKTISIRNSLGRVMVGARENVFIKKYGLNGFLVLDNRALNPFVK
jgi:hypothetical protein